MQNNTQEHRAWQKQTALRKVTDLRNEAEYIGRPISDFQLANAAAAYAGASERDVLKWMRGQ
jgi:hypothetical protein